MSPLGLDGASPALAAFTAALRSAARTDATVLLTGETGTGKGVAARALHARSGRRAAPLVHVDCAGLAPTVIESELFGHERGAFTGALARRIGRLEQAGRGTLFLDEIADLTPRLQGKLLRVLQDREFERVGGTCTLRLDARVVAATSRDLATAVRTGEFRPDLFYRLAVVELRLPPLRERVEDLPALVHTGLARISAALGRPAPTADRALLAELARHPWPGNVRELMNLLERLLVVRFEDPLGAQSLRAVGWRPGVGPDALAAPAARAAPAAPVAPCRERDALLAMLRETGGNVSRAARRMGVPRSTLRHRILRHGLAPALSRD